MLKVTWDDVETICQDLGQKISQFAMPEVVYAIPRGGLIPGTILSHILGVPLVTDYDTLWFKYLSQGKRALVVDDINDTGKTLKILSSHENVQTIVLYERKGSCVRADWVGHTINHNGWLIFPWEQVDNASKEMIEYLERRHGKVGV
jgi:hypoxanthine phosphoribosyltransferase